ncbi:MAG: GGDEF domain-containing protein [Actinobacteria bacterium]|nr:GGDEF domain-containing protein [Actinomycetota bacterium]
MAAVHESLRNDNRLTALTAAGMYGSAAFVSFVEDFVPGGPTPTIAPGIAALVLVTALLLAGPRLPRRALALLGPLGVALIAVALATSPGAGDGAVLYMWPVIWMSYFFGRRGAIAIVGCVAAAHVCVLLALPAADGYADRWVDVTVSVAIVAAVVQTLAHRNDRLLDLVAEEARTDALTGLLNRRGFDERAAVELAHSRREGACIAVACFDIDHFKRINDEWGHETGDRVLEHVGAVLTACAREIDAVARFGGEEFVVLLPGATVADAVGFTDRIHEAFASPHEGLPSVCVSAGVAASLAPDGIEPLLHHADTALYAAKSGGRNRTHVFTEIALTA